MRGLVVLLGITVATACAPLPPPAPPRQTSLGLELSSFTLPNGLRVALVADPRATEVSVTMRYQVGAADDPSGQAGIAHLVEHLMYQQVLGAQSLFAHLEDLATSFNGETTLDATVFTARGQPAHLDELLSIEAVRMGFHCTSITDETFAREREVVVNELRERDAATQTYDALARAIYPADHPYGRARGDEASVAAITRAQACAFADAHYAPSSAVLVVSGNLAQPRLQAGLAKFLGKLPRREVAVQPGVAEVAAAERHVQTRGPVDDEVLIVAWPLPVEPKLRIELLATVEVAYGVIDEAVRGRVATLRLGDERAPMIAFAIAPTLDETIDEVATATRSALATLPDRLIEHGLRGELVFDQLQQRANYRLYAGLEREDERDARIAGYVLAGRDPSAALAAEFRGVRELTAAAAAELVGTYLAPNRATFVTLAPVGKPRGHAPALGAPSHDIGLRRDAPDPAAAHAPAAPRTIPAFAAMRTRTLANGLRVVLLPLTSVPTVDARLVFAAGTGDETVNERGVALVAGYGLTWDLRYLNDLLLFAGSGGGGGVDVALDHTSFYAEGLDMHLDLLLAGLRRLVREGKYGAGAGSVIAALRREGKRAEDEGVITDAWRVARFGAGHPYVAAGLVRYAQHGLDANSAAGFRADHYAPSNATLVISGRFDAALADRWIDFLFADWAGDAVARKMPMTTPVPASLAYDAETSQVGLTIALPAKVGTRAMQLVAAAMLAEVAGDVRHQLGASYGLDARLDEARLASAYAITGRIEAGRAVEAVKLLRDRIAALRADPDAAASAFVAARGRVLTHLLGATGSAEVLGERVQHDLDLDLAPLSDLETAVAVRTLAVDAMGPVLGELDLARAAVLLQGPQPEIDAAFAALGREAKHLHAVAPRVRANADSEDPTTQAPRVAATVEPDPTEFEDAITMQHPRHVAILLDGGLALGSISERNVNGFGAHASLGYQSGDAEFGIYAAGGALSGTYSAGVDLSALTRAISTQPLELGGYAEIHAYARLWVRAEVGAAATHVVDFNTPMVWNTCLDLALVGGVDIVSIGRNQLDAVVRLDTQLPGAGGYTAATLGIALRR